MTKIAQRLERGKTEICCCKNKQTKKTCDKVLALYVGQFSII